MAPKQKKEDKRVRSLVLGVRLAPKLRYAVELAARKQRRSASSFQPLVLYSMERQSLWKRG